MFAHSRTILQRFCYQSLRKIATVKIHNKLNNLNKSALFRKIALGCGVALSINYVYGIEDDTIRTVKSLMQRHVNQLRSEFGQTTIYP